jgi:hypothetical protein
MCIGSRSVQYIRLLLLRFQASVLGYIGLRKVSVLFLLVKLFDYNSLGYVRL